MTFIVTHRRHHVLYVVWAPCLCSCGSSDSGLGQLHPFSPILLLVYNSWEYYVQDAPRIVLDKLEKVGFRVISMTGVGQTLVWCLHKESLESPCILPF